MQPDKKDKIFIKGKEGLPLVVFIHGMGMNSSAWAEPAKARVLGGSYALRVLLKGEFADMETSFQDLEAMGYSVLTWTQSRPVGPISIAVTELHSLISEYSMHAGKGTIFICHSRGGLIARKYLGDSGLSAKALITIATPHMGTTMARWAVFLQPVTFAFNSLVKGFSKKDVDSAFRRVLGFLGSSGLKELLPGSVFYRRLRDRRHEGGLYISVGGTDPDLLGPVGLPISDFLSRLVSGWIVPEELREGYGDGLVSAQSAVLPYADEHRDFHLNHVEMLFDKQVRAYIAGKVREFSG